METQAAVINTNTRGSEWLAVEKKVKAWTYNKSKSGYWAFDDVEDLVSATMMICLDSGSVVGVYKKVLQVARDTGVWQLKANNKTNKFGYSYIRRDSLELSLDNEMDNANDDDHVSLHDAFAHPQIAIDEAIMKEQMIDQLDEMILLFAEPIQRAYHMLRNEEAETLSAAAAAVGISDATMSNAMKELGRAVTGKSRRAKESYDSQIEKEMMTYYETVNSVTNKPKKQRQQKAQKKESMLPTLFGLDELLTKK